MNIEKTHPEYDSHWQRWEFYLRSYMGGQDYIDGKYLTRYINESDEEYKRRLQLTPMDNHCKNIVYGVYLQHVTIIQRLTVPLLNPF